MINKKEVKKLIMASIIKSFSLSEDENRMMEELNLSPTALIKSKLEEIKQSQSVTIELLKETQRQRDKFREKMTKAIEFITSKNLYDEFFGLNNVVQ